MGWKDTLSFVVPKSTKHEVAGQDLNFYPISFLLGHRARSFGKAVSNSLRVLFADNRNDTEQSQRDHMNEAKESLHVVEIKAVNPDLAKFREQQKHDAINGILDACLAPENLLLVAEVIADSLRDANFEKNSNGTIKAPELQAFAQELTVPAVIELLTGVMKANKAALRPLERMLPPGVGAMFRKAAEAKSETTSPSPSLSLVTETSSPTTDSG